MFKRYLDNEIAADLHEKMVFISGPRQVGKTTLAVELGEKRYKGKTLYLNWDDRKDRKNILDERFEGDKKLIIFDEIHKYKKWKNYLKGIYDKNKKIFNIAVTGSAKLDIYRKGGDSLLGRHRHYRLHPLSLGELVFPRRKCNAGIFKSLEFGKQDKERREILAALLKFGGFPEVYSKQSEKKLRQWHNEKVDLLVKEEIRDIENIKDLSALQVLAELLPEKAGSLLSINSVREDLSVNFRTAASWIDILERFYYHFRIYPYQSRKINALKKEAKLYLWDWSELREEGSKFENLIAAHLLKFTHYLFDAEGYKAKLHYLRDREQREVDFLITIDNKPWFAVEVKHSSRNISKPLKFFTSKLDIPFSYQVVNKKGIDFIEKGIRVISADKFLTSLI
ncbi:MAG: ATP-binding protein [Elusimicrobia bacterium]|nr:ATP-binding protein [Elusimicrobiota bacterium]